MKIWLVSSGEYSDYTVNGLFDDEHRSEAEAFAVLTQGRVEEDSFELNPEYQEPPSGQMFFTFHMGKDGTTRNWITESPLDVMGRLRVCRYRQVDNPSIIPWYIYIATYARDKNHAVKIANEVRIQVLAGAKPETGSL